MTHKHAYLAMLCLVFWSTVASAAGYYLDIEETDDSTWPYAILTYTGDGDEVATFWIADNHFGVTGSINFEIINDASNQPEYVIISTDEMTYDDVLIHIATTTPAELFQVLNETMPAPGDPEYDAWYQGLLLFTIRNNNQLTPCDSDLNKTVTKYLQMAKADDQVSAMSTFMGFINHLADVDVSCNQ